MPEALAVSRGLIDDSQAGGYSAIATQFHVDFYPYDEVKPWVDGTLAYAAAQQVPIWTAKRWLEFTEARAATHDHQLRVERGHWPAVLLHDRAGRCRRAVADGAAGLRAARC